MISTASSAERPRSGEPEACAATPWKRNFPEMFASDCEPSTTLPLAGCQTMTASTSSNTPSRTMNTLPEPPSSAGVPIMRSVPFTSFACIHCLSAIADATLPVPNRWCPQPCPAPLALSARRTGTLSCESPGSASNSPRSAITGFPVPNSATNAVGSPATLSFTVNPPALNSDCKSAELRTS